ncbi:MAG: hypothetical protein LBT30_06780 [Clostridiales bacterium]|jgi:hypothetical protein|nr:hypothetical protein [Clostridiales bacterium]
MYNFEHEIDKPQDEKIAYYLYSDYFHDGVIFDIKRSLDGVIIFIRCVREEEEWYKANKGTYDEKTAKLKESEQIHTYQIIFKKYKYFNHEHGQYYGFANGEYLNGRFKRSALCLKIEDKTKRLHYHFRIQTSCGYIDIICEKICIKKQIGRVKNVTLQFDPFMSRWLNRNELTNNDGEPDMDKIFELAESQDDIDRYLALTYLGITRNERAIFYARNCMKSDDTKTDSRVTSIWILGEFGDESDIAILMKELLNIETEYLSYKSYHSPIMEKRNIIDAIEKIQYRMLKNNEMKS